MSVCVYFRGWNSQTPAILVHPSSHIYSVILNLANDSHTLFNLRGIWALCTQRGNRPRCLCHLSWYGDSLLETTGCRQMRTPPCFPSSRCSINLSNSHWHGNIM